ncbi:MAG: hypothetical protein MUP16_04925, partial [Sedimentisphaerales bacterium]|nr:hypothetical protein [Sedimentisphaerales bacterium]
MKRIILLIGIFVVLVIFPAPPLPAEQEEPNIAEPNIVEPNIAEPDIFKQKTLMIEKTDLRVMVKQLEK